MSRCTSHGIAATRCRADDTQRVNGRVNSSCSNLVRPSSHAARPCVAAHAAAAVRMPESGERIVHSHEPFVDNMNVNDIAATVHVDRLCKVVVKVQGGTDKLAMVGELSQLGSWSPQHGVVADSRGAIRAVLPVAAFEFKLALRNGSEWVMEEGSNRRVDIPAVAAKMGNAGFVEITCSLGDTHATRVALKVNIPQFTKQLQDARERAVSMQHRRDELESTMQRLDSVIAAKDAEIASLNGNINMLEHDTAQQHAELHAACGSMSVMMREHMQLLALAACCHIPSDDSQPPTLPYRDDVTAPAQHHGGTGDLVILSMPDMHAVHEQNGAGAVQAPHGEAAGFLNGSFAQVYDHGDVTAGGEGDVSNDVIDPYQSTILDRAYDDLGAAAALLVAQHAVMSPQHATMAAQQSVSSNSKTANDCVDDQPLITLDGKRVAQCAVLCVVAFAVLQHLVSHAL